MPLNHANQIRFRPNGRAVYYGSSVHGHIFDGKYTTAHRDILEDGDVIYQLVGVVKKKPKIEKKQKPLELGRTYKRVNGAYQDVTIIAKDIDGNFIGRNENKILNIYSPTGRLLEERARGLQDRGVDTKFDLKVEYDEVEVDTELVIEPVKE